MRKLIDLITEASEHTPPPSKGPQRIRVSRALEAINSADFKTEAGANQVLKALSHLCDSILAWVENRGEVALAARKAVGEAKTMFPRDSQHLISNPSSVRNIRDGLALIRKSLKKYDVVLETQQRDPIDWYERRDELQPEMVFRDYHGDLVKLDRRVPGDGSQWYVAVRWGNSWSYDDSIIEPGDLVEKISDGA
jgi:hypothetical protein